jgi:DNA-binding LacI/PurR family transcriptional regulator
VPQREIGVMAGELLLECISHPSLTRQVLLEAVLVVRESTEPAVVRSRR